MLEGRIIPAVQAEKLTGLALLLNRFERDDMERAVDLLIAMMDARDGDPEDQQANGDELDGTGGEDDFWPHALQATAGCPISDPGEDEESPTDTAWLENLDQTARQPYRARAVTFVDHGSGEAIGVLEDAEDDGEDQCEAGDDGCGFHCGGHRSGWGAMPDHSDFEETLQSAVTPYTEANDA